MGHITKPGKVDFLNFRILDSFKKTIQVRSFGKIRNEMEQIQQKVYRIFRTLKRNLISYFKNKFNHGSF